MLTKHQKLGDLALVQGESKVIVIQPKAKNGLNSGGASYEYELVINRLGVREELFKTNGIKSMNTSKIVFEIPSEFTQRWRGKFEYIITARYDTGKLVKGIGMITIV